MAGIVCAGHVNWDVTLQVDSLPEPDDEAVIGDQIQAGGGSASNTAAVLAGMDHEPVLLGSLGDDEYATLASRELLDANVDCTYLQRVSDAQTTVKYLVVDQEGQVMVLANDGANEQFEAADLPQTALETAEHLHLTSQYPETALALAERAIESGVPVSFDPGRRLGQRAFGAILERADLVFLNEQETETARERGLLESSDGETILKRGDGGAELRQNGRTVTHSGFDVSTVDTAGAGDAFAAGFLAARLDGYADEQALAIGNACGAIAVQSTGARTSLSWAAVELFREINTE